MEISSDGVTIKLSQVEIETLHSELDSLFDAAGMMPFTQERANQYPLVNKLFFVLYEKHV